LPAEIQLRLVQAVAPDSPMGRILLGTSSAYVAQAIGLQRANRRTIYVNGLRQPSQSTAEILAWRTNPIDVCDGGESYFGVEFDPATKTFSHFAFNGHA
jgi:hypothetical protein